MNNSILQASYLTLSKSKNLLSRLSNDQLCNDQIPPYHSSIGSHIRHILDFYTCIFKGIESGVVDLTSRDRDVSVETNCQCALDYMDSILYRLKNTTINDIQTIDVVDNLGQGNLNIKYTIGSLLAQANSHTIHHYAIINYMLEHIGIHIEDEDFGLNPTSPKKMVSSK